MFLFEYFKVVVYFSVHSVVVVIFVVCTVIAILSCKIVVLCF